MPKFKFYGDNQRINIPEIQREIDLVENAEASEDEADSIDTSNPFECRMKGRTQDIYIGERIDFGGEGVIYKTNMNGWLAKLYYPKFLKTGVRESKINLMVDNPVNDGRICWPIGSLYYSDGRFAGLAMMEAKGESIDIDSPGDLADFFQKDRENLLKTLINVMSIFEVLNSNQIVMGDINFSNLMIDPSTYNVTLIDLDGAQIDKYPCLGCKENFNAPELFSDVSDEDEDEEQVANLHYHHFYSGFYRDNFSLASYNFMMMMGVPPYRSKGEKKIINLANRRFAYSMSDANETLQHEQDVFSARWSHLPYFMREAFYTAFTTDDPAKRPSAKQWKEKLQYYLSLLKGGTLNSLDPNCRVLYDLRDSPLDYSLLWNVRMAVSKRYVGTGFSMMDAIRRMTKSMKEDSESLGLDEHELASLLRQRTEISIGKTTKVKLLLNIGILKKVCIETNSSQ